MIFYNGQIIKFYDIFISSLIESPPTVPTETSIETRD